jgi:cytochrome c-type biogenesis protein CcmH/NrfG
VLVGAAKAVEIVMRVTPFVLVLGVAASTMAVPVAGQRADDQISPESVTLLKQGETALAAGKLVEADDALEAALTADPRNRAAFVALAKVATRQKLYGQAIRFTNRALQLEPTDREALLVQGQAMVEAGASARAREVLARLQKLCASGCPEATTLSAAIARGPTLAQVKPAATTKKN